MGLFGPKRVDPENVHVEAAPEEAKPEAAPAGGGNAQLAIEFTKLNAQLDSLKEARKGTAEQIAQIREQMGELRGMIVNTDKSVSTIEVKTTKAVDMVESVQPDKMMITIQKQDSKIEGLKANIESNETMMKTVMDELKEVRLKMGLFKGVDQLIKMTEEGKAQITNITKINATIERHADKVETIYTESQKAFAEFRQLVDDYKSLTKQFKDLSQSFDQIKVKVEGSAGKKELEALIGKFNEFEKRVSGIVDLLDKHANDLPIKLDDRFKAAEKRFEDKFQHMNAIFKSVDEFEKNYPKVSEQLKMPAPLPAQPAPADVPKLSDPTPEKKPAGGLGIITGLFKKGEKKEAGKP